MSDIRQLARWTRKTLLEERAWHNERLTEITRALRELDEEESQLTPVTSQSSSAMRAFRAAGDIASGQRKP